MWRLAAEIRPASPTPASACVRSNRRSEASREPATDQQPTPNQQASRAGLAAASTPRDPSLAAPHDHQPQPASSATHGRRRAEHRPAAPPRLPTPRAHKPRARMKAYTSRARQPQDQPWRPLPKNGFPTHLTGTTGFPLRRRRPAGTPPPLGSNGCLSPLASVGGGRRASSLRVCPMRSIPLV